MVLERNIVASPLVVVCKFLVIWMQAMPFIFTHLAIPWWLCVDLVLKLVCNLGPSLHGIYNMNYWIHNICLCNIFHMFAPDEHKHFIMLPIDIALLSFVVVVGSSFGTLAFSSKTCVFAFITKINSIKLVAYKWLQEEDAKERWERCRREMWRCNIKMQRCEKWFGKEMRKMMQKRDVMCRC